MEDWLVNFQVNQKQSSLGRQKPREENLYCIHESKAANGEKQDQAKCDQLCVGCLQVGELEQFKELHRALCTTYNVYVAIQVMMGDHSGSTCLSFLLH